MRVEPDVSARLDTLHGLYGRDQSLSDILDGLYTKLGRARLLSGRERLDPDAPQTVQARLRPIRRRLDSGYVARQRWIATETWLKPGQSNEWTGTAWSRQASKPERPRPPDQGAGHYEHALMRKFAKRPTEAFV
jgi:hypothetical protein